MEKRHRGAICRNPGRVQGGQSMSSFSIPFSGPRLWLAAAIGSTALALAGCGGGGMSDLDWDLRPSGRFSTADAARGSTAARPAADARGVISYPGYQVVVAQRGDRVSDVASRLGIDARSLAEHNALSPDTALRGGELLVLPGRVSESVTPPSITATPLGPVSAAPAGPEPLRHTVARGETAYTIARLYNVSPRSIGEWNGLPADLGVREGQILMIPVVQTVQTASIGAGPAEPVGAPLNAAGVGMPTATAAAPAATTSLPGQGSATPVPPSAAAPLPATTSASTPAAPAAPVADMSSQRTQGPRLAMPVQGRVIRAYAQGRNDGIGIGAPVGTPVQAAAAGTVAAITTDTEQVPILVIRHDNNLLTVYANIDAISVARGDRVTRGQTIAQVRRGDPSFLHFEVREGFDSVDPMPYLQ